MQKGSVCARGRAKKKMWIFSLAKGHTQRGKILGFLKGDVVWMLPPTSKESCEFIRLFNG